MVVPMVVKIPPSTDLVRGEAAAKLLIISSLIPAWSEKNYHFKLSEEMEPWYLRGVWSFSDRYLSGSPWQGRQIKALQSINDVSIQDSYPAIWSDRDVFQSYSNEIMAMSQTFHM